MAEQSYNPIVPVKVGNRRASARSGHYSPNAKDNFCFDRVLGYR